MNLLTHRLAIKADQPSQRMPWENCRAVPNPTAQNMLMRPNKDELETTVHGCHFPGDMAVCIRKVLARPLGCTS